MVFQGFCWIVIILFTGCSTFNREKVPTASLSKLGACSVDDVRDPASKNKTPGTEGCTIALETEAPLFAYATPSVFRNIPDAELVLKFLRMPAAEADSFGADPKNRIFMEKFNIAFRQIRTVAALHNKTIYHFLAERGEADAITYLHRDSRKLWKEKGDESFSPIKLDFAGIPPAGYALNNRHMEAYSCLTNLERLNGGIASEKLSFSAIDLDEAACKALPAEVQAVTNRVFHYYRLVDQTGDATLSKATRESALQEMYALFSSDIVYARNNTDIYWNKAEFKNFYENIRDIEGSHDQIQIKTLKQLPSGYIYIATHGRFRGRIKSSGKPIEAYFFDHFIYNSKDGTFTRRMSDIDSKI